MTRRRDFLITAGVGLLAATRMQAQPVKPAANPARANPMPESLRQALERDPNIPVLGNPQGRITVSEFFDYNCSYCRKMLPVIQELIRTDSDVRVVLHEWPVFGADSEAAARLSLASWPRGSYGRFHAGLLSLKSPANEASALRVARQLGLNEAQLRQSVAQDDRIENHLTKSFLLAEHMGLVGTPSFICGDEAAFGAMSVTQMRALVARGRQTLGIV